MVLLLAIVCLLVHKVLHLAKKRLHCKIKDWSGNMYMYMTSFTCQFVDTCSLLFYALFPKSCCIPCNLTNCLIYKYKQFLMVFVYAGLSQHCLIYFIDHLWNKLIVCNIFISSHFPLPVYISTLLTLYIQLFNGNIFPSFVIGLIYFVLLLFK